VKAKKKKTNLLIIASSEKDANLYYASGFLAPDPFIFFEIKGKRYVIMNDLEIDRARTQAKGAHVVASSKVARQFRERYGRQAGLLDITETFAKQNRIKHFLVPGNFPIEYGDRLRKRGFKIDFKSNPFFPKREIKTQDEVKAITRAIRHVEQAVGQAIGILKKSTVRRGKLYDRGSLLTSDTIKKIMNASLLEHHMFGTHAIVACGQHSIDPHDEGSGPLYANQSIIMDI